MDKKLLKEFPEPSNERRARILGFKDNKEYQETLKKLKSKYNIT